MPKPCNYVMQAQSSPERDTSLGHFQSFMAEKYRFGLDRTS